MGFHSLFICHKELFHFPTSSHSSPQFFLLVRCRCSDKLLDLAETSSCFSQHFIRFTIIVHEKQTHRNSGYKLVFYSLVWPREWIYWIAQPHAKSYTTYQNANLAVLDARYLLGAE